MGITKEGLFKYQPLSERQRKNLLILDAIRKKGPISKADLSKQLGYNIVTLSHYVDEYLSKGLACERGVDASSGGRRPVLLELNKDDFFIIGVDFSRACLSGIIVDAKLNIISEVKAARPHIEQADVEAGINSLLKDLINKSGVDAAKIKLISIATYGMIGESNMTIKGLDEEKGKSRATVYFGQLKQSIEKDFGIKTFFGSDAAFAAFGEKANNLTVDTDNMLYMFQDIGKGVVIKGEIYCGTDIGSADLEGVTGSLSNEMKLKLKEDSIYLRPWNAKMSLKGEAMRVIESGVGTKIVELVKGDLGALDDEVIIKATVDKDEIATELIVGIGINLGVRIAYLINLFSPRVVIVGGGIEKAGELLFGQIEKTVEKLSLKKPRQAVRILPSTLGDRAVTLGAASVGMREVFLES